MKNVFTKLFTVLFVFGPFFGGRAFAQSPLDWKTAQKFNNGVETTVTWPRN